MLCEEGPRHQPKRDDVPERADVEKRAPAEPVDQPQADKSENEIRNANPDRLQQRRFGTETR